MPSGTLTPGARLSALEPLGARSRRFRPLNYAENAGKVALNAFRNAEIHQLRHRSGLACPETLRTRLKHLRALYKLADSLESPQIYAKNALLRGLLRDPKMQNERRTVSRQTWRDTGKGRCHKII
eukprot:scaffold2069_cov254-Pinguiococcus_pyrenoidosus.AAC.6